MESETHSGICGILFLLKGYKLPRKLQASLGPFRSLVHTRGATDEETVRFGGNSLPVEADTFRAPARESVKDPRRPRLISEHELHEAAETVTTGVGESENWATDKPATPIRPRTSERRKRKQLNSRLSCQLFGTDSEEN